MLCFFIYSGLLNGLMLLQFIVIENTFESIFKILVCRSPCSMWHCVHCGDNPFFMFWNLSEDMFKRFQLYHPGHHPVRFSIFTDQRPARVSLQHITQTVIWRYCQISYFHLHSRCPFCPRSSRSHRLHSPRSEWHSPPWELRSYDWGVYQSTPTQRHCTDEASCRLLQPVLWSSRGEKAWPYSSTSGRKTHVSTYFKMRYQSRGIIAPLVTLGHFAKYWGRNLL